MGGSKIRYNEKADVENCIKVLETYFKTNEGKKLALHTIYNNLSMKRRKTLWLINQSKHIRKCNPIEVGSNKHTIQVYSYKI